MPIRGTCACKQCDFLIDGCDSCGKCWPRYRCCKVTKIPTDYNNECEIVSVFKMAYSCGNGWSEIPQLPSRDPIGVNVDVVRVSSTGDIAADCRYSVNINGELFYVALDDLEGNVFEVDGDGYSYEVEILGAGGVCYPYSFAACSPCKCGTCMPTTLNVVITNIMPSQQIICPDVGCSAIAWDEESLQYQGVVVVGNVNINVVGYALPNECAILIEFSGDTPGSIPDMPDVKLSLEGGAQSDCETPDHFKCMVRHSSSSDSRDILRGSGDCLGSVATFLVDSTTFVEYPGTVGTQMMSIRITDGSCGGCTDINDDCPGSCVGLTSHCSVSPSLSGTLLSDCPEIDGRTVTLSPGGGGPLDALMPEGVCQEWHGELNITCGGWTQYLYFALYYIPNACPDSPARPDRYRLLFQFGPLATVLATLSPTISACVPTLFEFTLPLSWADIAAAIPGSNCCDGYTGPVTIRITA